MLQKLLTDRFHLTVHHETRDFPGYELVVAEGGTKLKEAAPEDAFDPTNPCSSATGRQRLPGQAAPALTGGTSMPRSRHVEHDPLQQPNFDVAVLSHFRGHGEWNRTECR